MNPDKNEGILRRIAVENDRYTLNLIRVINDCGNPGSN